MAGIQGKTEGNECPTDACALRTLPAVPIQIIGKILFIRILFAILHVMLDTHLLLKVEEKKERGYPNSLSRYTDLIISIFLKI